MKRHADYGMAALVFVCTMVLMNGGAFVFSLGAVIPGMMLGGLNGIDIGYEYLMEHLSFFSCLIYLLPGTLAFLWYYFAFAEPAGMRRFVRMRTRRLSPVCFFLAIPLAFAVQHLTSLLMGVIALVLPSSMEEYMELVESSGLTSYSAAWAVATLILPPLVEEVLFRGLIFGYLRRAGACFAVANLIQAVLFGIFHMNLVQGIYAAVLGFLLGYLAWRYESLLVPMALHALFNFFGTVVIDLESRFLPDLVLGIFVMAGVPVAAVVLVLMHFGIGEKKR